MKFFVSAIFLLLTILSVYIPYLMLFPMWGTSSLMPQDIGRIPLWGQLLAVAIFWFLFFINILERRNFPEKIMRNWGLIGLSCYFISALLLTLSAGGFQVLNPLVWSLIVFSLTVLAILCKVLSAKQGEHA